MTTMATNTESIRGMYEAFARGDVPAVLASLALDVSWTEAEGFPDGGTYTGPNAVLENVALGMHRGEYKATGRSFSAPFAHVWTVRNGKVAKFRQYTDTALVQKALR